MRNADKPFRARGDGFRKFVHFIVVFVFAERSFKVFERCARGRRPHKQTIQALFEIISGYLHSLGIRREFFRNGAHRESRSRGFAHNVLSHHARARYPRDLIQRGSNYFYAVILADKRSAFVKLWQIFFGYSHKIKYFGDIFARFYIHQQRRRIQRARSRKLARESV